MSTPRRAMSQGQMIAIAAVVIVIAAAGYWYMSSQTPAVVTPPANQKRLLRTTWPLPFYIDPSVGTDGASSTAEFTMYDSLVRIDFDGKLIPWVAESWTTSADNLSYTFKIKKGIKFHDGTELDANDVAWSLQRFVTLGTGRAYLITKFKPVATVIDANTVKITLNSAFGPFVSALNTFYILNKDLVLTHLKADSTQYGELKDYGKEWLTANDAGSGAYKVKLFNIGSKLVMEKHATYFQPFKDKSPDIVEMIGTTEAMTVRTMLSNKELEVSDTWQSRENLKEIAKLTGVKIAGTMDTSGGWFLMMNTKKAPLDDVHVRRALEYAYDYGTLTTTLFPDTIKMTGPVNSATPGYNPNTTPVFTFDVTKAKAELALSKYATNIAQYPIELHWCAEVPDEEKGAMLFQSNAAAIGITVNVVKTPWTSMVQEAASVATKPHIMYISASGDYPEAGSILFNRYASAQALTWWQNENLMDATLDAMLDDAIKTIDYAARMEKYKVIQQYIVDLAPTIWMYQGISYRAYQDYVTVPYVKYGKAEKLGSLGQVYSTQGSQGFEFRLFEVDRLVTYAS